MILFEIVRCKQSTDALTRLGRQWIGKLAAATEKCSFGRNQNAAKLETKFFKVMQQQYVCEVGKSITFVLHIISVYFVPNIVEIGQHV